MKKIDKQDKEPQDAYVWIELRSVQGKPGWLSDRSEWIAFATRRSFLLVKRERLLNFVKENTDEKDGVSSAKDPLVQN